MRKSTGDAGGFENIVDLGKGVVKSITEGKTQVVFESPMAAETALDRFIFNLRQGGSFGASNLLRYCKLPNRCGRC